MSNKSKSTTSEQSRVTPTNPAFVTNSVKGLQGRIDQLGQQDPREFVAPASPLQNTAFGMGAGLANRMAGGSTLDFSNLQIGGDNTGALPGLISLDQAGGMGQGPQQPSSNPFPLGSQGGAEAAYGSQAIGNVQTGAFTPPPATTQPVGEPIPVGTGPFTASMNAAQPEQSYGDLYPDVAAEARRQAGFGFRSDGVPATFDANGDGRMQEGEYFDFHKQRFGAAEGRNISAPSAVSAPAVALPQPQQFQNREPVTGAAVGQVDPIALGGPNPADFFSGAGLLAGSAGLAGANTVGGVAESTADTLGPATGYQAQGPATVATYDAAGPAQTQDAQAFTGRSTGMAPTMFGSASLLGPAQGVTAPTATAQQAGAQGYDPATGQAAQTGAQSYNASFAGSRGYDPTTAGAMFAGSRGYEAATAAAAQARAQGYSAAQAEAIGYQAMLADLESLPQASASRAAAAQIDQDRIDALMSPYQDQVVDATLADFDEEAARLRAQQRAQAAGAGAFGGSRFGVREAVTEGELARARASTQAGLLSDSYNFAAGLANEDAGRAQQASMTNAQLGTRANLANAQMGMQGLLANMDAYNSAAMFGADAANRASLANAGFSNDARRFSADAQNQASNLNAQLGTQVSLSNADSLNRASEFGAEAFNRAALQNAQLGTQANLFNADAFNTAGQFGADAANRASLANAGFANEASRFGAGAANDAALSNAGFAQQMNLANMDAFNTAGQFGADAQNRAALQNAQLGTNVSLNNAGLLADSLQFNAGEQNRFALADQQAANQFGLANMDAFNRAGLDAAGRADQMTLANMGQLADASRFNADAANRSALDFAGRSDAAGQFGADAFNRSFLDYAGRADAAGQFNAGEANRFDLAQFDANTQANFRNADARNNMAQFNAGQRDNMLQRQLAAAGLLGDLGATIGAEDRANIGLLAGLGNEQREIDRAFRNAEPTMVQLLAALQAQQPYGLFQGQNSTGTSTTTTKQTGPAVWNQAASAIGKGVSAGAGVGLF